MHSPMPAQDDSASVQLVYDTLVTQLKKEPGRADLRVMLFQWLAVKGQWERAVSQLAMAATLDREAEAMAYAYREVLRCENYRAKVFAGEKLPLFIGEPEEWLALLVEALRLNAIERPQEAAQLRARALESAAATSGAADGVPFAWMADADMRMGPVLEAYMNGKYFWIPLSCLVKIEIEPPESVRDLVWAPTWLTFVAGGRQAAFIPTRYPGSEHATEDAFLLARKTEWRNLGSDTWIGLGQRMLTTDETELALLDTRVIEFDHGHHSPSHPIVASSEPAAT